MPRVAFGALAVCILFSVLLPASRAADVLQKVPADALGFVVARELGSLDANAQKLLTKLQLPYGGPLAFLQAATGISEGLDTQGSLLVAAVPDGAVGNQPKFCVWIPIADYDRFLTSLGSKPAAGISAVTVADVDLLVAKAGDSALVMDPDERNRMERLLTAAPAPPRQLSPWRNWIGTHDAVAVIFAGGLHDLLGWAVSAPGAGESASSEESSEIPMEFAPFDEEDIFAESEPRHGRRADDVGSRLRSSIRTVLTSSPRALQSAHAIDAVALGFRLDEQENLLAGMRVAWNKDSNFAPGAVGSDGNAPPSIYEGGRIIAHGAGHLPQPFTAVLAGAYVRLLIEDLKSEMGLALDSDTVARFQDAVEQAAAEAPSASLLTLVGEKDDGIYTKRFVVVRADSGDKFADQANEVMRLWNQMNREADSGTRLVFDVEEVTSGERTATHYSIDIAALDDAAVIPEVRQVMEKFFGQGGKLRLIVAPVEGHHVLLAMATPEQAERVLQSLRTGPAQWDGGDVARSPRELLPRKGDWQLYFSPSGYTQWRARQMDAMTGPVIGGPIIKPYPPSPPIGVMGGAKDYELWIDAAVPSGTILGAGEHLKAQRRPNRRQ